MKTCTKCHEEKPEDAFYVRDKKTGRRNTQCIECVRSRVASHQERLKKERKCFHCSEPLSEEDVSLCSECKTKRRAEYHADGERRREVGRDRKRQLKVTVFEAYGGVFCKCCGETEPKFLAIDHINENGAEHRRQLKKDYGYIVEIYRWLKNNNYPPGFQVLCFNCNFAKGHFGVCPHEVERRRASLSVVK